MSVLLLLNNADWISICENCYSIDIIFAQQPGPLLGGWGRLSLDFWASNQCSLWGAISVPSEVRNRAVPPDILRSAISFSRTSNIVNLRHIYIYISHSSFKDTNASLFVCLHAFSAQQNIRLLSVVRNKTYVCVDLFLQILIKACFYNINTPYQADRLFQARKMNFS